MADKLRIAVASFSHETCTFCPNPTTVENFERGGVYHGEEVLEKVRGIPTYINGFIRATEEDGGVELVGILSAARSWGGSSGSWLTTECFDKYSKGIAEGLREAVRLDGLLLALHGGMAVTGVPRPEAEIVRRAKEAIGDIPIMVTFDMHGNEDQEIVEVADGVFSIKTFPHVDSEDTGAEAARCIFDTVRGEFTPVMVLRKPGVISPGVFQYTGAHPMKTLIERANEWERREEKARWVSVMPGFPYADVPDAGFTVIALTDGDRELAERIADDLADLVWELRVPLASRHVPKPEEGVKKVMNLVAEGKRPVIIADHSDRTGDGTHVLAQLLMHGARNFAISTIKDSDAVIRIMEEADMGDTVTVMVGGREMLSGDPVELTGRVEFLGDGGYIKNGPLGRGSRTLLGPTAALDLGENNHVVVSSTLHQVTDSAGITAFGIDFESLDIISLKSRVHFRAFYEPVAGAIVEIDSPGLGPADLTTINYKNVPRDIYPFIKTKAHADSS
jgi:microcystin degradation protein MlrC